MNKFLFAVLLIPSIAFSQARVRNYHLSQNDSIVLIDSSVVSALRGSLSFPFDLRIRDQYKTKSEIVTAVSFQGFANGFGQLKVTRGVDGLNSDFNENDLLDLYNVTTTANASATTGTFAVPMNTKWVKITPTGNCIFNATGASNSEFVTFLITTSGTSSFNLNWNTNFVSATLATGAVSGKRFKVVFERMDDGVTYQEISRTAAQ